METPLGKQLQTVTITAESEKVSTRVGGIGSDTTLKEGVYQTGGEFRGREDF